MALAKLGSGKRFQALANKFAHKGIDNPGALAASIGRKKYGKKKFEKLSEHGRERYQYREKHRDDKS